MKTMSVLNHSRRRLTSSCAASSCCTKRSSFVCVFGFRLPRRCNERMPAAPIATPNGLSKGTAVSAKRGKGLVASSVILRRIAILFVAFMAGVILFLSNEVSAAGDPVVVVKSPTGESIPVTGMTMNRDPASEVKRIVKKKIALKDAEYRLLFNGTPLDMNMSLEAQQIPKGSVIEVEKLPTAELKFPDGSKQDIVLFHELTIGAVKSVVRDKKNYPMEVLILSANGKQLPTKLDMTLKEAGVEPGDHLEVSVRTPVLSIFTSRGGGSNLYETDYDKDTIWKIKGGITGKVGLSPEAVMLIYNGRRLQDQLTLPQQHVPRGSQVQAMKVPTLTMTVSDGRKLLVMLYPDLTFGQLREQVLEKTKIPPDQQSFTLEDKELQLPEDHVLVSSIGVRARSHVKVVRRPIVRAIAPNNERVDLFTINPNEDLIDKVVAEVLSGSSMVPTGLDPLSFIDFYSLQYNPPGEAPVPLDSKKTLKQSNVPLGAEVQVNALPFVTVRIPSEKDGEKPVTKPIKFSTPMSEIQDAVSKLGGIDPSAMMLVRADGTPVDLTKSKDGKGPPQTVGDLDFHPGEVVSAKKRAPLSVQIEEGDVVDLPDVDLDKDDAATAKYKLLTALNERPSASTNALSGTLPEHFDLMKSSPDKKTKSPLKAGTPLKKQGIPFGTTVEVKKKPLLKLKLPDGSDFLFPMDKSLDDLKKDLVKATNISPEALEITLPDGKTLAPDDPSEPLTSCGIPAESTGSVRRKPPVAVQFDDGEVVEVPEIDHAATPVKDVVKRAIDKRYGNKKGKDIPEPEFAKLVRDDPAVGSVDLKPEEALKAQGVPYGETVALKPVPTIDVKHPDGKSSRIPQTVSFQELKELLAKATGIPPHAQSMKLEDGQPFDGPDNKPLTETGVPTGSSVKLAKKPSVVVDLPDGRQLPVYDVSHDDDPVQKVKEAVAAGVSKHKGKKMRPEVFDLEKPVEGSADGARLDPKKSLKDQGVPYAGRVKMHPIPQLLYVLPNGDEVMLPLSTPIKEMLEKVSAASGIPKEALTFRANDKPVLEGVDNDSPDAAKPLSSLGLADGTQVSVGKKAPLNIEMPDGKLVAVSGVDPRTDSVAKIKEALVDQLPSAAPTPETVGILLDPKKAEDPATVDAAKKAVTDLKPEQFEFTVKKKNGKKAVLAPKKTPKEQGVPYGGTVAFYRIPVVRVEKPDGTTVEIPKKTKMAAVKQKLAEMTGIPPEEQLFSVNNGPFEAFNVPEDTTLSGMNIPTDADVKLKRQAPVTVQLDDGTEVPLENVSHANDPVDAIKEALLAELPKIKPTDELSQLKPKHFELVPVGSETAGDGSKMGKKPENMEKSPPEPAGEALANDQSLKDQGIPYGKTVRPRKVPHVQVQLPDGSTVDLPASLPAEEFQKELEKLSGIPAKEQGLECAGEPISLSEVPGSSPIADVGIPADQPLKLRRKPPVQIELDDGSVVPLPDVDHDEDNIADVKSKFLDELRKQLPKHPLAERTPELIELSEKTGNKDAEKLDPKKTLPEQNVPYGSTLGVDPVPLLSCETPDGKTVQVPQNIPLAAAKALIEEATGIPEQAQKLSLPDGTTLKPVNADDPISALNIPSETPVTLSKMPPLTVVLDDGTEVPLESVSHADDPVLNVKEALLAELPKVKPDDKLAKLKPTHFELVAEPEETGAESEPTSDRGILGTGRLPKPTGDALRDDKSLNDQWVPYGQKVRPRKIPHVAFDLPDGSTSELPAAMPLKDMRKALAAVSGIPEEQQGLEAGDTPVTIAGVSEDSPISALSVPTDLPLKIVKKAPLEVEIPDGTVVPLPDVKFDEDPVKDIKKQFQDELGKMKPDHPLATRPLSTFKLVPRKDGSIGVENAPKGSSDGAESGDGTEDSEDEAMSANSFGEPLDEEKTLPEQNIPYGSKVTPQLTPYVEVAMPDGSSLVLPTDTTIGDVRDQLKDKAGIPAEQQLLERDGAPLKTASLSDDTPLSALSLPDGEKVQLTRLAPVSVQLNDGSVVPLANVDHTDDPVSAIKNALLDELVKVDPEASLRKLQPAQFELRPLAADGTIDANANVLDDDKTLKEQNVPFGATVGTKKVPIITAVLPNGQEVEIPQNTPMNALRKKLADLTGIPENQQSLLRPNGLALDSDPESVLSGLGLPSGTKISVGKKAPVSIKIDERTVIPVRDVDRANDTVADVKMKFLEEVRKKFPKVPVGLRRPEFFEFIDKVPSDEEIESNDVKKLDTSKTLPEQDIPYGAVLGVDQIPLLAVGLPDGGQVQVPQNIPLAAVKALLKDAAGIPEEAQHLALPEGHTLKTVKPEDSVSALGLPTGTPVTLSRKAPVTVVLEDGTAVPLPAIVHDKDNVAGIKEALLSELNDMHPENPGFAALTPDAFEFTKKTPDGGTEKLSPLKTLEAQGVPYGSDIGMTKLPVLKVRTHSGFVKAVPLPAGLKMPEQVKSVAEAVGVEDPAKLVLLYRRNPLDLSSEQDSIIGQLADPADEVQVGMFSVKGPSGAVHHFPQDPKSLTGKQLKSLIEALTGIPASGQQLEVGDREIRDDAPLGDQSVDEGGELTLSKVQPKPQFTGNLTVELESGRHLVVSGLEPTSSVAQVKNGLAVKLRGKRAGKSGPKIAGSDFQLFFEGNEMHDDHSLVDEAVPLGSKVFAKLRRNTCDVDVISMDGRTIKFEKVPTATKLDSFKEQVADSVGVPAGNFDLVTKSGKLLSDLSATLRGLGFKDKETLVMEAGGMGMMSMNSVQEEKPRAVASSMHTRVSGEVDVFFRDLIAPGKSLVQDGAAQAAVDDKAYQILMHYQTRRTTAFLALTAVLFLIAALITCCVNVLAYKAEKKHDRFGAMVLSTVFKAITAIAIVLSLIEILLQIDVVEWGLEELFFGDVMKMFPDFQLYFVESGVEKRFDDLLSIGLIFVVVYILYALIFALFCYRVNSWARDVDTTDGNTLVGTASKNGPSNATVAYHALRYEFTDAVASVSIPGLDPRGYFFAEYLRAAMLSMTVSIVRLPNIAIAVFFAIALIWLPIPFITANQEVALVVGLSYGPPLALAVLFFRAAMVKRQLFPADCRKYVQMRWNSEVAGSPIADEQERNENRHLFPKYSNGSTTTQKSTLSFKMATSLYGTTAPTNHEALFFFWRNGPPVLLRCVEFCVLSSMLLCTWAFYLTQNKYTVWQEMHGPWSWLAVYLAATITLVVMYFLFWDLLIITSTSGMVNKTVLQEVWEEERALLVRRVAGFVDMLHTESVLHKFETGGKDFWDTELARSHEVPEPVYDQNLEIFNRLDTDGDGLINETDLYHWLLSQGISCPRESHAKRWFDVFDHDSNGGIDRGEFFVLIVVVKQLIRAEVDMADKMALLDEAFGISRSTPITKKTLSNLIDKLYLQWSKNHKVQLFDLVAPLHRESEGVDVTTFLENLHLLENRMLRSLQQAVGDLKTAHGLPEEAPATAAPGDTSMLGAQFLGGKSAIHQSSRLPAESDVGDSALVVGTSHVPRQHAGSRDVDHSSELVLTRGAGDE